MIVEAWLGRFRRRNSRMRRNPRHLWSVVALMVAGVASAGNVRAQPAAQGGADSPRQQVIRSFEERAPAIGALLPDVAAHDGEGRPLRLSSLKGTHTVLVFGCLT
jgi:hypothetical protein